MNAMRLFTVRGVPVRLHWTFLLVLPLFAGSAVSLEGWGALGWGLAQIVILFGCVILHELAHTVVAQGYGVRVRGIILYPIGGQALLDRIPESPRQEAAITVVGPLFNAVFAVLVFA